MGQGNYRPPASPPLPPLQKIRLVIRFVIIDVLSKLTLIFVGSKITTVAVMRLHGIRRRSRVEVLPKALYKDRKTKASLIHHCCDRAKPTHLGNVLLPLMRDRVKRWQGLNLEAVAHLVLGHLALVVTVGLLVLLRLGSPRILRRDQMILENALLLLMQMLRSVLRVWLLSLRLQAVVKLPIGGLELIRLTRRLTLRLTLRLTHSRNALN